MIITKDDDRKEQTTTLVNIICNETFPVSFYYYMEKMKKSRLHPRSFSVQLAHNTNPECMSGGDNVLAKGQSLREADAGFPLMMMACLGFTLQD